MEQIDPMPQLCVYDPRNPNYLDWEENEEPPTPRTNCACDNCFYGRDTLALEIIQLTNKLGKIASVAAELDKEFWFDPSVSGGTCLDCDANLNPHRWGKHATDCLFEKLHQVITGGGE